MSNIEIRELNGSDDKLIWNNLVYHSPQSTAPHLYEWLKIIEKNHNAKLHLICGFLGEEVIGGVPLYSKKSICGRCVESPLSGAQLQQLGPIFRDYDLLKQDKREYYFREFWKCLDEYITEKLKIRNISVTTSPNLSDARPYIWNNYSVIPKYNYVKDITNLDAVWDDFKKQLRKNIDKCEKSELKVYLGDYNDYEHIYNSVSDRLNEQGTNLSTSKKYMDDLFNELHPDFIKIFMVSDKDDNPLSGILTTTFNGKISIWFGATQTNIKGIYPIDLLQWEIIKWGNQNSMKTCEIQGANMPSISYFKSRYNFNLDEYYSIKKNNVFTYVKDLVNILLK